MEPLSVIARDNFVLEPDGLKFVARVRNPRSEWVEDVVVEVMVGDSVVWKPPPLFIPDHSSVRVGLLVPTEYVLATGQPPTFNGSVRVRVFDPATGVTLHAEPQSIDSWENV
jgi:hypothetical protein